MGSLPLHNIVQGSREGNSDITRCNHAKESVPTNTFTDLILKAQDQCAITDFYLGAPLSEEADDDWVLSHVESKYKTVALKKHAKNW